MPPKKNTAPDIRRELSPIQSEHASNMAKRLFSQNWNPEMDLSQMQQLAEQSTFAAVVFILALDQEETEE